MFQSRAVGWPPGCSSPGGRAAILLTGLLRSAAPQMLQSRGPLSCFLATPRMFQSRALVAHPVVLSPSVRSPPDAAFQGAVHFVFAGQWQGQKQGQGQLQGQGQWQGLGQGQRQGQWQGQGLVQRLGQGGQGQGQGQWQGQGRGRGRSRGSGRGRGRGRRSG